MADELPGEYLDQDLVDALLELTRQRGCDCGDPQVRKVEEKPGVFVPNVYHLDGCGILVKIENQRQAARWN